jgi:hypothetical protein
VRTVPATEVELTVYKCLGDRHRWPHRPSSSLDVGTRGYVGLRAGWMPDGQRLVPQIGGNIDPYKHTKCISLVMDESIRTTRHNRPVIFLCSSARNI